MMMHAYAPTTQAAPDLYAQYTYVRELGLSWGDLRPPLEQWEINLLAQMINIHTKAMEQKARVQSTAKRK